jgi:Ras and Rab interactor 2/3
VKSPLNPFKASESIRSKRHNGRRKESKHYQESDILESPSVYCRSNLGDKISDYEDLWTQENNNSRSSLHIALDTPTNKGNEILSPMVIFPPQLLTPLVGNEVAITTNQSPMQPTKMMFESKRSPFYSDPVDLVPAFPQIIRREPKPNPLPSFHRYSEPPKGQFEDLNFHSSPIEQEKGFTPTIVAGSLDHLKTPTGNGNKLINNHRLDPTWTVDSSWEFVDKNDDSSESSSIRNVKHLTPQNSLKHRNSNQHRKMNTIERQLVAMSVDSYLMNSRKSNVYKMVARKYPDINLKPTPPPSNTIPSTWQTFDSDCSSKFQRLSSYDNVVEQQSVYGSAASEDGTLFSEPWDSSQWDSFMPTTDGN